MHVSRINFTSLFNEFGSGWKIQILSIEKSQIFQPLLQGTVHMSITITYFNTNYLNHYRIRSSFWLSGLGISFSLNIFIKTEYRLGSCLPPIKTCSGPEPLHNLIARPSITQGIDGQKGPVSTAFSPSTH